VGGILDAGGTVNRMKGRIFVTLFALPFFSVGAWMLASIGSTLHDAWRMQDWEPVAAQLIAAGYETRAGDDSDTHEAYARYSYRYRGRDYEGDRVGLQGGADNIGDYQVDTGNRLSAMRSRGEAVTAWVNPAAPAQSIIDRDIRWGLVGFKSIFLFVFGGFGLGLLVYTWTRPKATDPSPAQYQDAPWLRNDAWQTPEIRSGSRVAMWGAWAFAAFWNAISAVTPFIAYREVVDSQNHLALIALVFPLVGLWLLTWAVRRTLEWRRFGPAPVMLDPFPGSIGGHVGGTIDLALPFDSTAKFHVTLTNLYSYVSGSGKNRSRKEDAKWQDERLAHAGPGGKGTRITFRFDVPGGLDESDAVPNGTSHYRWRLHLRVELPGTDVDRDYDIPVYATARQSRHLPERAMRRSRDERDALADGRIRDRVEIRHKPMGKTMFYPMGRHLGPNLIGLVIGSVFAAAGWFLVVQEGQAIFGGIFAGVGALVALGAFYMMTNSLEVSRNGTSVNTVRRWLGIPIGRRHMPLSRFARFEKKSSMKTQSGGRHVIYYGINMLDRDGNKLAVGEGFRGESEARAAMRMIAQELGLRVEPGSAESEPGKRVVDEGVLTADF
jgi:hypothetical protein